VTSRPILPQEFLHLAIRRSPDLTALFFFERASAIVLLLLFSPVLAVLSLTIFIMSGEAPVIGDRRVGLNGQPFWMFKLRTMWPRNAVGDYRLSWIEYLHTQGRRERKSAADPRVTSAFAGFCRKHSLDELLQLWHVARGQMSYVGPRPLTLDELRQHYGVEMSEVLSMKPGLSGLWQVTGRSRLSYSQRRRLDLRLVRNYSAGLYFAILRRTVRYVLKGDSAW
jgi:lipopolysaccharide/colanic/teichoic acid biosynthesis glycosyltransferase